jgi:hypothetical protein
MADSDKTAPDVPVQGDGVSAQRRRTAQARAERELRLAGSLRANIARRKQQARDRTAGAPPAPAGPETDDDPAS